jgi:hypothetical protein
VTDAEQRTIYDGVTGAALPRPIPRGATPARRTRKRAASSAGRGGSAKKKGRVAAPVGRSALEEPTPVQRDDPAPQAPPEWPAPLDPAALRAALNPDDPAALGAATAQAPFDPAAQAARDEAALAAALAAFDEAPDDQSALAAAMAAFERAPDGSQLGSALPAGWLGVAIPSGTYLAAATDAPRQRVAADALPVFPGWYNLAAHGLPPGAGGGAGALVLGGGTVTAEDLVAMLPSLSGWNMSRPRLVLIACASQALAIRLRALYRQHHGVGLEIVAAEGTVWQLPEGAVTAGSYRIDAAGRAVPSTGPASHASGSDRGPAGRAGAPVGTAGRWVHLPAATTEVHPMGPDLVTVMGRLGARMRASMAGASLDDVVSWAPERTPATTAAKRFPGNSPWTGPGTPNCSGSTSACPVMLGSASAGPSTGMPWSSTTSAARRFTGTASRTAPTPNVVIDREARNQAAGKQVASGHPTDGPPTHGNRSIRAPSGGPAPPGLLPPLDSAAIHAALNPAYDRTAAPVTGDEQAAVERAADGLPARGLAVLARAAAEQAAREQAARERAALAAFNQPTAPGPFDQPGLGPHAASDPSGLAGRSADAPVSDQPAGRLYPPPDPAVAGWYPDPTNRWQLRYWNGTHWTGHVQPRSG